MCMPSMVCLCFCMCVHVCVYKEGTEEALHKYSEVAGFFGLTVSVPKTKLMVTVREATDTDRTPITVGDEQVECVSEFSYLGSVIFHHLAGCNLTLTRG